jgi:hypothetical protein
MVLLIQDYSPMSAVTAVGGTTHFGFQQVPLPEKQALVDDVFRSVANRYDLMNDLMSGGLHRAWKDALVTAVNPPKSARAFKVLDLAGGNKSVTAWGLAFASIGIFGVLAPLARRFYKQPTP